MLKNNLIANYLGQGWVALMGLLFVPVYIRYLGIEAYGLIGIFAILQSWLALLDVGMAPTLSREMGRFTGGSVSGQSIRDLLRSVEILAALLAGVVALLILAGSGWLAEDWLKVERLSSSTVAQALSIMGLVAALQFLNGIYRNSLRGLQRQVRLNLISAVIATIRAVGAVAVLAWVSPTLEAFFVWQLAVSVISLFALMTSTYQYLPSIGREARFSLSALQGIGRFAGGMAGITLLSLFLTQIDKILLSKLLALSDYGYYMVAFLAASGLRMLVAPIALAWYPRMTQLHAAGNTEKLTEVYHIGAQLVCVLMGAASIILIIFSDTILLLWTQDPDLVTASSALVKWLAFGNLLNGFMTLPYYAQLAHGWTGYAIRVNLISAILIVPAILFMVPKFGAMGAAYAWVGLNIGYLVIAVHFMYMRILKTEKWRWYWEDIIRPMLFAITAATIFRHYFPQGEGALHQVVQLLAASILVLLATICGAKRIVGIVRSYLSPVFGKTLH